MFVNSYNFVNFLLFCLNACFLKYCFILFFFPRILLDVFIVLLALKLQYPVKSLSSDHKFLQSTFITDCFLSPSITKDSFLDLVVWVSSCDLKIYQVLKDVIQDHWLLKFLLRCEMLFCFCYLFMWLGVSSSLFVFLNVFFCCCCSVLEICFDGGDFSFLVLSPWYSVFLFYLDELSFLQLGNFLL